MQEAKYQSQYCIDPSITVQDVEKKFKCLHGNQAHFLCTSSQCQEPKAIICRTNDCTCDQLHTNCHTVNLKAILTKLYKRQCNIAQDIQKSYKVAHQSINAMIKQLSQVRDRLQMRQKYFEFQECQLSFIKFIQQQNFEKVCGKFISELEKKLQCKKEIYIKSNKRILQEFQKTKAKFDSLCEYIQNSIMALVPRPYAKITPDKQSRGLKDGNYVIDNTNSNVCIKNDRSNWLCSSALPFDGEFVFTIKVIKLTQWIRIGLMEEEKKGEEKGYTKKYSVYLYLNPNSQQIYRPNEEQTDYQGIKCSCSSLPKCPFQIECHVNRQQNTIAWHYDGKQQAKSTLPKAWKTNKKQLCAIVDVISKGNSVQMM